MHPCEVVIADFAWFSQTCNKIAPYKIRCMDPHCGSFDHHHYVCEDHRKKTE